MRVFHLTLLMLILPASPVTAAHDPDSPDAAVSRGEYVTTAAGCLACHTDSENDGVPFAGGHELETPFGNFYTPNITPDPDTGIGNWSEAEFVTALRQGKRPDGKHYYPAFPYPSYAGMTGQDARDIYAWLQTLEPVNQPNRPNELHWYVPGRWAMAIWNRLFSPWEYQPAADTQNPQWNRGAYLVRQLGHCGECHTPRNVFGALDTSRELTGSPKDSTGRGAPNISPDREQGIGNWAEDELLFFLELGMLPDGDFAGGSMTAVIDDNIALLTDADREAIVLFLSNPSGPPADD